MTGYQVTNSAQFTTTLISAAVGIVLCLMYDILRIIRMAHRPSVIQAFIQDVLWWLSAAVLTYGLLLVRCNGSVRAYPLIGETVGFLSCRFTLSVLIMRVAKVLVAFFGRVNRAFKCKVAAPVCRAAGRLASFVSEKLKKLGKIVKNLLKHTGSIVYNHVKSRKVSDQG